eukprot:5506577-Pyramimonas_sp.AAC.2
MSNRRRCKGTANACLVNSGAKRAKGANGVNSEVKGANAGAKGVNAGSEGANAGSEGMNAARLKCALSSSAASKLRSS